jgi:hypothetical protein
MAAHDGQSWMGIRPEHIDECGAPGADPARVVKATVDVVEMMGAEVYLYASAGRPPSPPASTPPAASTSAIPSRWRWTWTRSISSAAPAKRASSGSLEPWTERNLSNHEPAHALAFSELIQTLAVMVVAYAVLTLLAIFFKAESATWKKPEDPRP